MGNAGLLALSRLPGSFSREDGSCVIDTNLGSTAEQIATWVVLCIRTIPPMPPGAFR